MHIFLGQWTDFWAMLLVFSFWGWMFWMPWRNLFAKIEETQTQKFDSKLINFNISHKSVQRRYFLYVFCMSFAELILYRQDCIKLSFFFEASRKFLNFWKWHTRRLHLGSNDQIILIYLVLSNRICNFCFKIQFQSMVLHIFSLV